MTKIRALLFDKDGTLFDFAHTWEAWASAFLGRLCDPDQNRKKSVGKAIGFDVETEKFSPNSIVIAGTPEEVVNELMPFFADMTAIDLATILDDEAEKAPQIEAVPLVPLLTKFRARGLSLGVATNDTERPARAHLYRAGIIDMFDFIAGSDSGFGGKPTPGQLLAFAEHVQIPPHQIAMVGDSTHDLRAGRAAGMVTVGVLTGLAARETLAPFADVVMPDIGHLLDWLTARSTSEIWSEA